MPPRRAGPVGLSHLRVTLSDDFYIGPGRADLLELIAETGSITEAARRMGMSYKRAWGLVQALNAGFSAPLVETARGGAGQGGARVTATGLALIKHYRHMQQVTGAAIADDVAALTAMLRDMAERK